MLMLFNEWLKLLNCNVEQVEFKTFRKNKTRVTKATFGKFGYYLTTIYFSGRRKTYAIAICDFPNKKAYTILSNLAREKNLYDEFEFRRIPWREDYLDDPILSEYFSENENETFKNHFVNTVNSYKNVITTIAYR